ncbi:MAG: UvrD-helicase domain-containing protein [Clostridiales bacterium]|nr:UvrD-helicase domain-containing protein [Clostridiales bacterium]
MSGRDPQRIEEEAYLARVYEAITAQLARAVAKREDIRKDTIELQRGLWREVGVGMKDDGKNAVSAQYLSELRVNKAIYGNNDAVLTKLERMKSSAYFGRVDFARPGRPQRPTYIGISTLFDEKDMSTLVCDWRAPVGSLFYEDRTGAVSYKGPDGIIEGELTGKRQYKIEEDRLIYYFDSALTIDDEMLRQALAGSSDAHMRTIVNTIQQNQNRVIREPLRQRIVVEGSAGSGKTAVALHRAAWLLYRYREEGLSHENLLLLTPNQVFVEYIREVLPELGEQNVATATLTDCMRGLIPKQYRIETTWAALDFALSFSHRPRTRHEQRLRGILGGGGLAAYVRSYAEKLAGERTFFDLRFEGELIASADEMAALYAVRPAMPPRTRLNRVARMAAQRIGELYRKRLASMTETLKERGEEERDARRMARRALRRLFAPVADQLRMMTALRVEEAFRDMWSEGAFVWATGDPPRVEWDELCAMVLEQIQDRALSSEAAALYAYLRVLLSGAPKSGIRHLIIDEGQDYSAAEMRLLESLYPGTGMTILRDANQRIQTHLTEEGLPTGAEIIRLQRSYRSSRSLCDFTRHLLRDPDSVIPFEREGEKPRLIRVQEAERPARVAQDIAALRRMGPVAVIGRTAAQCRRIFESLEALVPGAVLLKPDEPRPSAQVTVLPSWLAKGLEFDTVMLWEAADFGRGEKSLFYTVCTRALHRLRLYTAQPGYAPPVPAALYEEDDAPGGGTG